MLLIIIWYFFHNNFWPRPWPQPHSPGLGLEVLASFNITDAYCSPTVVQINSRTFTVRIIYFK